MYLPEALIHGARTSEFPAAPYMPGAATSVVEGAQPSGAVAPRQVSRRNTLNFPFEAPTAKFEARD